MKNVYSDKTELKRLIIQGKLFSEYESPVYREIIKNRKNLSVLDVGCNNGNKTIHTFASGIFSKIIGIDCLKSMVDRANQNFADDVRNFYRCDVSAGNFSKKIKSIMKAEGIKAFDIINCSFVLMHLKNPLEVLKRLRPLLAPDGYLVIIEPDDTTSRMTPDRDKLFERFLSILSQDPYSGKRDSGSRIPSLLDEAGCKEVRLKLKEISGAEEETDKKENIFTVFCSYLPEDLLLLQKEQPDNVSYQEWWDWVQQNFESLHTQMTAQGTVISMGIKIFVAGGNADAG